MVLKRGTKSPQRTVADFRSGARGGGVDPRRRSAGLPNTSTEFWRGSSSSDAGEGHATDRARLSAGSMHMDRRSRRTSAESRSRRTSTESHDLKLERRFTDDKNTSLIRKSLKLYEFTEKLSGLRDSPCRLAAFSDGDEEELLPGTRHSKGQTPNAGAIRVEAGVLSDSSSSKSRLDWATEYGEDTKTTELNPTVFVCSRTGVWPSRSLLARIGFSVPLSTMVCRKEVQVALNQSSELCHIAKINKECILIDVVDVVRHEFAGLAEVRVDQEYMEGIDDLSPWNSPRLLSLVHFDIPVDSIPALQESILELYVKVRRHFETLLDESERVDSKPSFLALPAKMPVPVYDVLTHEEQCPKSTFSSQPGSTVSMSSSDDPPSTTSPCSSQKAVTAAFVSTRRPERCLKSLGRTLEATGYVVRRRSGFGIELELLEANLRPTVVFASARRDPSLGPHGVSRLTLEARVFPSSLEHDAFNNLCRHIGFNCRDLRRSRVDC